LKKDQTYAVIDLGTNTFHLLIAAGGSSNGSITEIARERRFVKLAEEGIDCIGAKPLQRGLDTLRYFRQLLDEHGIPPERVRAFGTAALRTASNGKAFIQQVSEEMNIEIRLITGEREALLIHKGVTLLLPPDEQPHLIMDIGGGSVEFILANREGVIWHRSFPIGVAVLHKNFYSSDPLSEGQLSSLQLFLKEQLAPLRQILQHNKTERLVGASGTFDVLDNLLSKPDSNKPYAHFSSQDFMPFYQQMLPTTVAERRAMPDMPEDRADMILVALVLVKTVLELADFKEIVVSHYAMKEGMLYEMFYE